MASLKLHASVDVYEYIQTAVSAQENQGMYDAKIDGDKVNIVESIIKLFIARKDMLQVNIMPSSEFIYTYRFIAII